VFDTRGWHHTVLIEGEIHAPANHREWTDEAARLFDEPVADGILEVDGEPEGTGPVAGPIRSPSSRSPAMAGAARDGAGRGVEGRC
jgi:hypothetical protein